MLKRLYAAFAALFVLTGSALAAGTIPFSLSQQLDKFGDPLSGGKLYLFRAGTTSTPQNCFQDIGLTIPLPNPVVLDAAGRSPQMFCADGVIKVRLVDKVGVTQVEADNIQVIGPSGGGGGGGGGSVDPTTIIATGDIKTRYGTGTLSGFVRANGRTIGSATSGATERANADCQALFQYLWATDSTLTVSGGRGASANADWVANKQLTLPDFRGRAMVALADMGNSANAYYDGVTFQTGNATTLGSWVGAARRTLSQSSLPATTYSLIGTAGTVTVLSTATDVVRGDVAPEVLQPGPFAFDKLGSGSGSSGQISSTGSFTPQGSIGPLGSGSAFDTVSPYIFVTVYLKL